MRFLTSRLIFVIALTISSSQADDSISIKSETPHLTTSKVIEIAKNYLNKNGAAWENYKIYGPVYFPEHKEWGFDFERKINGAVFYLFIEDKDNPNIRTVGGA